MVRAGKEATSGVLEIWDGTRVVAELQVPAKLHGSVFNDGWFSHGASWDPSEGRVAYVAEVRVHGKLMKKLPLQSNGTFHHGMRGVLLHFSPCQGNGACFLPGPCRD